MEHELAATTQLPALLCGMCSYTFGNIRDATGDDNLQPGQVKLLRPESKVTTITVTDTKGGTKTLERGTRPDFAYGDTERIGIYRAEWDDPTESSDSPSTSSMRTRAASSRDRAVQIGAEAIQAGETAQAAARIMEIVRARRAILLAAEWYVYNRRVFV